MSGNQVGQYGVTAMAIALCNVAEFGVRSGEHGESEHLLSIGC